MNRHRANLPALLRHALLSIALLLGPAAHGLEPAGLLRDFPRTRITLLTAERCTAIDVWVAATQAHHARGLMFVTAMAEHEGMLFIYGEPRVVAMWMKNTYIPLDMLFATADGYIKHIHRDAVPQDTTIISSEHEVSMVIELNAGRADALKLKRGDQVIVPGIY